MTRGKRKKQKQANERSQHHQQADSKPLPIVPEAPRPLHRIEDQPETRAAKQAAQDQDKRKDIRTSNRLERVQAIFAGCLVLFTFFQVVVGFFQWNSTHDQYIAMMDQNAVMREQNKLVEGQLDLMHMDQRPWLQFSTPKMNPLVANEDFTGSLTIENTGKTPATIIREGFAFILRPAVTIEKMSAKGRHGRYELNLNIDADINEFRRQEFMLPDAVLPAGGTAHYSLADIGPYPEGKIKVMEDGHLIVAILVYVKYLDMSGRTHETWMCFVYDHRTKQVYLHPQYGHMD